MALTTQKKKVLVILSIVFGLLIVGGATAYMIWRVTKLKILVMKRVVLRGVAGLIVPTVSEILEISAVRLNL